MSKNKEHTDFNIPSGYFEGFTERLLDKMSDSIEEQNEIHIPKKDGFKVPETYFDDLNENVLNQVKEPQAKVIELQPKKNFFYYAAAAVAAIVIVTIGFQTFNNNVTTIDTIAKSDIDAYFESNGFEMSTFELAEVIPVDNLEINDIIETQLSEDNIIEYLDQNIDEIEELNLSNYEY